MAVVLNLDQPELPPKRSKKLGLTFSQVPPIKSRSKGFVVEKENKHVSKMFLLLMSMRLWLTCNVNLKLKGLNFSYVMKKLHVIDWLPVTSKKGRKAKRIN